MSTAVNQINTLGTLPGGQIGTSTFPFGGDGSIKGLQSAKQTGKLADALAKAQAEFKSVNKSKTGKVKGTTKDGRPYEYEYKYADISDILEMAMPALAKHGIAFSQPLRREGDKLYVVTRLQLGDEFLEDAGLPVPTQVKPQELGMYLTYYRRYGVSTFLGIAADEDTDGPQEDKPVSTSGQNKREELYERKPAAKKSTTVKSGTVVAPEPPVQTAPPIATDQDVPAIIGDRPTMEQMKEIKARLNSFELDKDALKKYVLGKTGRENAGQLTKQQWDEVLAALDKAKADGNIAELVK
jgi:hypothetical protein